MSSKATDALSVETRPTSGTTASHALRRAGRVPAVIFGHGRPTVSVSIDLHALEELLHAGRRRALLTITLDNGASDTALIREIQRDPVSRKVVHADLQRVGRSESIVTTVAISIVGVARGVREAGGMLDIVSHEVDVKGPADQIPEHIEVDVSHLGLHEHITAGDLKLPAGFTLDTAADMVVAAVEPPRVAEVEAAATAPAEGEVPTVADGGSAPESAS
jgi:large subunit ribosomal protein L25